MLWANKHELNGATRMVDYEKIFSTYCDENDIAVSLCCVMPEGYETANGMFDPVCNKLFINKGSLKALPEYEQLFYLYHELRHASQYLRPEKYDDMICKSRFYAIMYDGACFKLVGEEWKECRPEGSGEFFSEMYLGQPYEIDANKYAYEKVKAIEGNSAELEELYAFWTPKREIPNSAYTDLYSKIDELLC